MTVNAQGQRWPGEYPEFSQMLHVLRSIHLDIWVLDDLNEEDESH
jgi:hypothetical protein